MKGYTSYTVTPVSIEVIEIEKNKLTIDLIFLISSLVLLKTSVTSVTLYKKGLKSGFKVL